MIYFSPLRKLDNSLITKQTFICIFRMCTLKAAFPILMLCINKIEEIVYDPHSFPLDKGSSGKNNGKP